MRWAPCWLTLLGLLLGCREQTAALPIERPVAFAEITDQQHPSEARFTGTVQPREQLAAAFRQSGRLLSRQVEVGQRVRRGQLLASLESTDQHSEVRSRQGEYQRAEVAWRNARDELARYQGLYRQGVGSLARLEQLHSELQVRAATMRQARIALRRAEAHVQQTQLLADIDGVVTAWHAEVGQVLASGTPVLGLARLDSLEVWVDLPARWLSALVATPPRIHVTSLNGAGEGSWAQVRQIDPVLDAGTRVQRVRLALERLPAELHLGSLASVQLVAPHTAPAPELPASALWMEAEQHFVWRIDGQSSQVHAVAVQVLGESGTNVRVRGPLQPGDRVVRAGVTRLREGQQVRLEERSGS
ncbi:efflux RND transporter periplasmic adaptor subunit [Pseudomonas sp. NCHU5208]|uniref:efflux RND transporter periplasmic adaptor subunit n=1 Tax=unclassified Pseudomonas TaxID=196821 RepID=UPI003F9D30E7